MRAIEIFAVKRRRSNWLMVPKTKWNLGVANEVWIEEEIQLGPYRVITSYASIATPKCQNHYPTPD